jgi:hypothetical protein
MSVGKVGYWPLYEVERGRRPRAHRDDASASSSGQRGRNALVLWLKIVKIFAEAARTIQRQPCGPAQSPLGTLSMLLFRPSAFSSFASTGVERE